MLTEGGEKLISWNLYMVKIVEKFSMVSNLFGRLAIIHINVNLLCLNFTKINCTTKLRTISFLLKFIIKVMLLQMS